MPRPLFAQRRLLDSANRTSRRSLKTLLIYYSILCCIGTDYADFSNGMDSKDLGYQEFTAGRDPFLFAADTPLVDCLGDARFFTGSDYIEIRRSPLIAVSRPHLAALPCENGLTTPSMKLRIRVAAERHVDHGSICTLSLIHI